MVGKPLPHLLKSSNLDFHLVRCWSQEAVLITVDLGKAWSIGGDKHLMDLGLK